MRVREPALQRACELLGLEVIATQVVPLPMDSASPELEALRVEYPWLAPDDLAAVASYRRGESWLWGELEKVLRGLGSLPGPVDLVLVTTDAQFEGAGRFVPWLRWPAIVVEARSLGAWARGPGYYHEPTSRVYRDDVVVHEIGHFVGLGHRCADCFGKGAEACCAACPGRDDIMSSCRHRPGADHERGVNGFGACGLGHIRERFVPAFFAGARACAGCRRLRGRRLSEACTGCQGPKDRRPLAEPAVAGCAPSRAHRRQR